MNEPTVTVVGNIAQQVRHVTTDQGVSITSFRMASTRRQYDRAAGRWVDGETTFLNVTCWRTLADHVYASVSKGDPVVVFGRLRVRPWEREGYKGNAVEVDAYTVGHDLSRGTSAFRRVSSRGSQPAPEREIADSLLMTMEVDGGRDGQSEGQSVGGPVGGPSPAVVAARASARAGQASDETSEQAGDRENDQVIDGVDKNGQSGSDESSPDSSWSERLAV